MTGLPSPRQMRNGRVDRNHDISKEITARYRRNRESRRERTSSQATQARHRTAQIALKTKHGPRILEHADRRASAMDRFASFL